MSKSGTLKKRSNFISKPSQFVICEEPKNHFDKLNDNITTYYKKSYFSGIKKTLKYSHEIIPLVKTGALIPLKQNQFYFIDTLRYSYAFLTPNSEMLLSEISKKFQQKIQNTNLKGAKIVVTSALRTTHKIRMLRKVNRNALKNSAHLHGTTFDIAYQTYYHPNKIKKAEKICLSEILTAVLFELKSQHKCWVTYEKFQSCFHVVDR